MTVKPLSADFLLSNGSCCGSGCTNCPFTPRQRKGMTDTDRKWINYSKNHPDETYDDYQHLLQ